jgi:superkiller protein 3
MDRASDAFSRALAMDPTMADAYNANGVVLTRGRKYDEALEMFDKALELNPNDAGFRVNKAIAFHLQGKKEDSKKAYKEAVAINQDFSGILDFMGKAPSAAVRAAAPAVDPLQRLAAEKAYDDGAAYLRLKALDRALDAFDRAINMDPNNAHAYNAKAVVLTRQRKYDTAIELLDKAVELNPNDAGYHLNLAITYHLQGKKNEAKQAYQAAVDRDKTLYGQLEFIEGVTSGSAAVASSASGVSTIQKLSSNKAYDDGAAYLRLKALDKAMDAFERSLALDSGNADAFNAQGVIQTKKRNYEEAIGLFTQAIGLDPQIGGFHFNLAIAYNLQGRKEDALRSYEKAVSLDASFEGQLEDLDK